MLAAIWIVLAACAYSALWFWRSVAPWWAKRQKLIAAVDLIPGPPAIPIFGCAHNFKWKIEDFSAQMFEYSNLFQELGEPIVRLWLGPFPVISTFSADSVKAVLESHKVIRKGSEYGIIMRWLGTGLLTSTGEKWRTRRKMLTPAFHFNVLNGFLVTHNKEAQIFVEHISEHANTNKTFNIFPYLKRLALDIICDTSMGCKVDAQTNHNHPYVGAVQRMNELSFLYTRMPWLWLRPIWYLSGYGADYDRNLRLVTEFTRKVISDRRQQFRIERERSKSEEELSLSIQRNGNGKSATNEGSENGAGTNGREGELGAKRRYAFLDLLLNIQSESGQLSDEDIREEVDTFMFEGHDTTSSGMAWSLWCLSHHPEQQERVLKEVDEIFGDSQRACTSEDLKRLKYLEQCIKEALRLFPPVPLFTRMVEEDFECVGYTVPRGATILIAPLILHRDERLFKNASAFNPDNFSAENSAARHPFAYVPFSAGPRNCIGQKFALMEEKTVLSWFFRRYTISAETPFEANLPCPEIILKPSKGIPVQIFKRYRANT